MAPLDLSDPQVSNAAHMLMLSFGVAIGCVLWNIADDVRTLRRNRRGKSKPKERRFIEPCADGLHTFTDGACTTCKSEEPPSA